MNRVTHLTMIEERSVFDKRRGGVAREGLVRTCRNLRQTGAREFRFHIYSVLLKGELFSV
jgi:hypothetical protein